jgi:hypothetical protein
MMTRIPGPSSPVPDGYLDKPIDEKGLLLNVRKILSLNRRRE